MVGNLYISLVESLHRKKREATEKSSYINEMKRKIDQVRVVFLFAYSCVHVCCCVLGEHLHRLVLLCNPFSVWDKIISIQTNKCSSTRLEYMHYDVFLNKTRVHALCCVPRQDSSTCIMM